MVEVESFAGLGHLRSDANTSRTKSSERTGTRKTTASKFASSQPFNLFRALGIQSKETNDRREAGTP